MVELCNGGELFDRIAQKEKYGEEEAADVLFCLLNFCARSNIDLDEAFERMLKKAKRKYPADRVRGKALKYNEYDEWSGSDDPA